MPTPSPAKKKSQQSPTHLPSPEEIRAMCELIPSEWSEAERKRREIGHPRRVEIREVQFPKAGDRNGGE